MYSNQCQHYKCFSIVIFGGLVGGEWMAKIPLLYLLRIEFEHLLMSPKYGSRQDQAKRAK